MFGWSYKLWFCSFMIENKCKKVPEVWSLEQQILIDPHLFTFFCFPWTELRASEGEEETLQLIASFRKKSFKFIPYEALCVVSLIPSGSRSFRLNLFIFLSFIVFFFNCRHTKAGQMKSLCLHFLLGNKSASYGVPYLTALVFSKNIYVYLEFPGECQKKYKRNDRLYYYSANWLQNTFKQSSDHIFWK